MKKTTYEKAYKLQNQISGLERDQKQLLADRTQFVKHFESATVKPKLLREGKNVADQEDDDFKLHDFDWMKVQLLFNRGHAPLYIEIEPFRLSPELLKEAIIDRFNKEINANIKLISDLQNQFNDLKDE